MRRVIVLRPEPGASETVARARALGLDAQAVPLFTIEPIAWRAPDPAGFDGLLLTSANAVRQAGSQLATLRGLPAYAVGAVTAEAARHAGFGIAVTGEAGVERLLDALAPELRLLHLCGEQRTEAKARQRITAIAVYRAVPVERPGLDAADAVALVHSPRAGRRLAELIGDRKAVAIAAISAAAAEAAGPGWAAVAIAERPTDEALLALAASLCNKPVPQ